jgi:hypothetical protein
LYVDEMAVRFRVTTGSFSVAAASVQEIVKQMCRMAHGANAASKVGGS